MQTLENCKILNRILSLSNFDLEIEIARRNFWEFCKLLQPSFYKENRWHLKQFCDILQKLYHGTLKKDKQTVKNLIVNMPPRMGKTRTLIYFCMWVLGRNNEERVIVASYNELTASDFGKYTRDGIQIEKFDPESIVYSDVFPDTKIKYGTASYLRWALAGQHFNFLSTSPLGSATSKGATIQIFDDMIKSAAEAYNERKLDKDWSFYNDTMSSRTEGEGGEITKIICMTHWARKDICGRIEDDQELYKEFYHLKIPVIDNGEMLCPSILSKKAHDGIKRNMDPAIYSANYLQKPIDILGRLYPNLKTYEELPKGENGELLTEGIYNYTDVADTGDDFVASGCYSVWQGTAYMLDVYYSDENAEITEKEVAAMLERCKVNIANFESNSGGRYYARNVERILLDYYKNKSILVSTFYQSDNKEGRIKSKSSEVQRLVLFPQNWKDRWPKYYDHMINFQSKIKENIHDDGADMTTGIVERMVPSIGFLT